MPDIGYRHTPEYPGPRYVPVLRRLICFARVFPTSMKNGIRKWSLWGEYSVRGIRHLLIFDRMTERTAGTKVDIACCLVTVSSKPPAPVWLAQSLQKTKSPWGCTARCSLRQTYFLGFNGQALNDIQRSELARPLLTHARILSPPVVHWQR